MPICGGARRVGEVPLGWISTSLSAAASLQTGTGILQLATDGGSCCVAMLEKPELEASRHCPNAPNITLCLPAEELQCRALHNAAQQQPKLGLGLIGSQSQSVPIPAPCFN